MATGRHFDWTLCRYVLLGEHGRSYAQRSDTPTEAASLDPQRQLLRARYEASCPPMQSAVRVGRFVPVPRLHSSTLTLSPTNTDTEGVQQFALPPLSPIDKHGNRIRRESRLQPRPRFPPDAAPHMPDIRHRVQRSSTVQAILFTNHTSVILIAATNAQGCGDGLQRYDKRL
ncbi:hypothetical protein CONLIGDRAFT_224510 [Coniochaeta ligniaria NRRL 30616]|uniref:Uncharacterized protein n=1 Tax=Coniochaeta ligniaria NRRL 30616 TaxID=1408157 RepID=A0A1J7I401_9PEZI|nr:hypothetical protein CONLIGDRAFT_224510 [Coniochaeta ligniaria NRRL 30616]